MFIFYMKQLKKRTYQAIVYSWMLLLSNKLLDVLNVNLQWNTKLFVIILLSFILVSFANWCIKDDDISLF